MLLLLASRPSLHILSPRIVHEQAVRGFSRTWHVRHSSQSFHRSTTAERTLASAKHKPSLSGPSLGHLLTELSATTPEMLKAGLRREGHTMNEEHRTLARKVTTVVLGLPLAFGSVVVGGVWFWQVDDKR